MSCINLDHKYCDGQDALRFLNSFSSNRSTQKMLRRDWNGKVTSDGIVLQTVHDVDVYVFLEKVEWIEREIYRHRTVSTNNLAVLLSGRKVE